VTRSFSFAWLATLLLACSGTLASSPPDDDGGTEPDDRDLPGTATCRPAPARLWQLTPLQLAHSFAALDAELAVPSARDRFLRTTPVSSPYTADAAREAASTPFLAEAVEVAREVAGRWSSTLDTCASRTCAAAFFEAAAERAWRRPPTADELTQWTDTFASLEAEHGGAVAARLVLEAILLSPHHLFRQELGAPSDERGIARLSPHEVADFVAFTLLDAPPDAPLRAAADDGSLADSAVLEREVRRLLALAPTPDSVADVDGRSAPRVTGVLRFFREWLEVERVASAPVGELLQTLPRDHPVRELGAERLARWLGNEPLLFAHRVVHEGDGKLATLLSADWTLYGNTLSNYYGVTRPPADAGLTRGDTADDRRGLLMQGAFLVGHKSTTHRGRWIRERLFCQPVPNPPPSVDNNLAGIQREAEEAAGRVLSPREVRDAHLAEPCADCHQHMDPLGFPFDGFDALGLPRETWPGDFPIDTAGAVEGTERSDTTVADATELMEHLAQSPDVRACFVRQLFQFVHGRSPAASDACVLDDLEQAFERSDGDVRELLVAMLTHDSIWTRLSEGASR
jgi:hypothetical protein